MCNGVPPDRALTRMVASPPRMRTQEARVWEDWFRGYCTCHRNFRRTGCFMRAVGSAGQCVAFEVAAAPAAPGRDRNEVLLADLEAEPARHLGRAGKEGSDPPPRIPFFGDDALA